MRAKIQAFREWVPERYSHLREEFMGVIMSGFGKARVHHIETFYSEIAGEPVTP